MHDIQTSRTFQERVFEKIREDLGNLLTEEELKSLLQAAMKKAFFENVVEKGYYSETVKPPLFVTMVKGLLEDKVRAAVDQWIRDHPEEFNKLIQDALAEGILGLIGKYLQNRFEEPLYNLKQELAQKGIIGASSTQVV